MRVLHIVRQFHPAIGGLENVVHDLSVEQRRGGIDADVLTLDRDFRDPQNVLPERDIIDGVPVRRIGYVGSKRYPVAPQVLSHLKPYDIIHVHGVDFFCDYLASTAALHRKPLVLTTHGGFFHTDFARTLKRVYFQTVTRNTLRKYKRVFACSASDADTFRAISGHRVKHVDNGVDIAKFSGASSETFKPSFVCFGRIASHKGLERALDTFEILRTQFPEATFQIIGNDADGTLPRLQQRYASLLQTGSLQFKTGLSDASIAAALRDCSFFVSASEYEGFGLALVEALSAGLIPLVNRIPSFEKIISDAGAGHIVDFSDPASAAETIGPIIKEAPQDYTQHRQRAMDGVKRYGWEGVARRIQSDYEAILGLKRRTILGVPFEPMKRAQAVVKIDSAFKQGITLRVAFANAHTLTLSKSNAAYRDALKDFLVLNDGVGVDLASRLKFGTTFPDNLNGTDFVPYYLSHTQHRLRIFLIGSKPDVVSDAARSFADTWPQHEVIGACDGYFKSEAHVDDVCRAIKAMRADLLLVGLGNPLQEMWIADRAAATGARLHMGVGALFDFTSGHTPRAPIWIRRARCEWAYRLSREPRRLSTRYIVGGARFVGYVLSDRRTGFSS